MLVHVCKQGIGGSIHAIFSSELQKEWFSFILTVPITKKALQKILTRTLEECATFYAASDWEKRNGDFGPTGDSLNCKS